jgi:hypothetical protein
LTAAGATVLRRLPTLVSQNDFFFFSAMTI